jgi:integrase
MKAANFSAERIAKFECEADKRQTFFRDGKTPGLGLRVTAAGSKTYVFETRLRNRTMRLTIGDVRTWTISAAQKEATRLKTLTDTGLDPRKVKAEQDAAEEAARRVVEGHALLVREAWDAYLKHHAKRWGQKYMASHLEVSKAGGEKKKKGGGQGLTMPGVLAPILQMRMKDISAPVLTEWVVKAAARRRGMAREGFVLFRTFWRWCATRSEYKSLIEADAINDKDLRAEVPARRNKRFDVLERSHLKPWFAAVRNLENPVIRSYLQAQLLTGARRNEMASLRWQDIDFKWSNMWVKDKVDAEGRKIPLTPYLATLLSTLPRVNNWVFSSQKARSGRLREPRAGHRRALKAAGLNYVTVHGLRRTFASLAEWLEMPRGVVAQLMGHKPNATAEKHYINRPLDLLAVWHNKYEAWILEQADVKFGKKQSRKKKSAAKAQPRLRLVSSR